MKVNENTIEKLNEKEIKIKNELKKLKLENVTTKDLEEKIAKLELQQSQIKKRKMLLKNKSNTQKRKERTRKLIQIGALTEKIFNLNHEDDIQKIESQLISYARRLHTKKFEE